MSQLQRRLLELIKDKDGQLSWYQLDRAISMESVEREESLLKCLTRLEAEGLIVSHASANLSQPTYSVTSEGENLVNR